MPANGYYTQKEDNIQGYRTDFALQIIAMLNIEKYIINKPQILLYYKSNPKASCEDRN